MGQAWCSGRRTTLQITLASPTLFRRSHRQYSKSLMPRRPRPDDFSSVYPQAEPGEMYLIHLLNRLSIVERVRFGAGVSVVSGAGVRGWHSNPVIHGEPIARARNCLANGISQLYFARPASAKICKTNSRNSHLAVALASQNPCNAVTLAAIATLLW